MNAGFAARSMDERRRRLRRLIMFAPLAIMGAIGLFFGLGFLVAWLWRVTLVDIFAIKPISFWQAWGIILLSQILFKAHIQRTMRTGHRWRHGHWHGESPETGPEQPPPGQQG